jgi:predicted heme/steroid binding protein
VSASFLWKDGVHQVVHRAGVDLTNALEQAPHGEDFLERFPLVGVMRDANLSSVP